MSTQSIQSSNSDVVLTTHEQSVVRSLILETITPAITVETHNTNYQTIKHVFNLNILDLNDLKKSLSSLYKFERSIEVQNLTDYTVDCALEKLETEMVSRTVYGKELSRTLIGLILNYITDIAIEGDCEFPGDGYNEAISILESIGINSIYYPASNTKSGVKNFSGRETALLSEDTKESLNSLSDDELIDLVVSLKNTFDQLENESRQFGYFLLIACMAFALLLRIYTENT